MLYELLSTRCAQGMWMMSLLLPLVVVMAYGTRGMPPAMLLHSFIQFTRETKMFTRIIQRLTVTWYLGNDFILYILSTRMPFQRRARRCVDVALSFIRRGAQAREIERRERNVSGKSVAQVFASEIIV